MIRFLIEKQQLVKTNAQMLGLCAVAGDWKPSDLFSNSLGRAEEGTVVFLFLLDN